ncbi:carbonic anhydrase 13-like [Sabethes cyaneus]|uniref:carbonic anhydrase 13-like n=1 Tax=Sabethes cyaneus TaxID=53552 RepID=UPI00237DD1BF|nr:carbonic anhydrase 13-like [Sabethes cyaneus]
MNQIPLPTDTADEALEETNSSFSEDPSKIVVALAEDEATLPAPIDININRSQQIELPPVSWQNYDQLPTKIKLTNTGETVILSAKWEDGVYPGLKCGYLDGRYVFSQLHFHWGNSAVEGSEHTIDGTPLPLEMHVVHFNDQYDTLEDALKHIGGVLCLVYFFSLKSTPNKFLEPVITNLKEIIFPDSVIKLTPFPIVNLFHAFTDDYFLYWGSTKAQSKSHPMLWLLSRTQECIDFHQLAQFRQLLDQRMRIIAREPPQVADGKDRHLFHVNPRTPCSNWTLSPLPHPRYRDNRWLVDRMDIDIGAPGGCQQFIEALRREMSNRRESSSSSEN